jgi:hypothetical protein
LLRDGSAATAQIVGDRAKWKKVVDTAKVVVE